jgi:hypothetical protein
LFSFRFSHSYIGRCGLFRNDLERFTKGQRSRSDGDNHGHHGERACRLFLLREVQRTVVGVALVAEVGMLCGRFAVAVVAGVLHVQIGKVILRL